MTQSCITASLGYSHRVSYTWIEAAHKFRLKQGSRCLTAAGSQAHSRPCVAALAPLLVVVNTYQVMAAEDWTVVPSIGYICFLNDAHTIC